jgi:hypothetical protein
MDPEPDMPVLARRSAPRPGVANISWVLGADRDLPALGALLARDGRRTDDRRRDAPRSEWEVRR